MLTKKRMLRATRFFICIDSGSRFINFGSPQFVNTSQPGMELETSTVSSVTYVSNLTKKSLKEVLNDICMDR